MKKILWNAGWTVAAGIPDPFAELFGSAAKPVPVQLPQDAMVLEQRTPDAPSGTQFGFYPLKSYTYEKKFFAPLEWKELETIVEWDGVMNQAMVYLNSEHLHSNHYGYSVFYTSLSAHLRYGEENTLRVMALNNEHCSRWYPGAGIYRDVWLRQGDKIHISPDGVRLTTEEITESYAVAAAKITVCNTGTEAKRIKLRISLLTPEGEEAAWEENTVSLLRTEQVTSHVRLYVDDPRLWSPDTPNLYQYKITLYDETTELDRAEGYFGIRTIHLDARKGLRINGAETKLRGACIHHDHGILGATILPDAEEFRLKKLKEAGFNSIRSAHHPAAPALLDACDRLGILVMDELSDMWDQPKNCADYAANFSDDWSSVMEQMVSKDYNHPSVILYSLGNEIPEIGRRGGGRRIRELSERLRALDPTRYITCAFSGFLAVSDHVEALMESLQQSAPETDSKGSSGSEALNAAMSKMERTRMDTISTSPLLVDALEEPSCEIDVAGYNYLTALHEHIHTLHPQRAVVGAETYPAEIARLWGIVKRNRHVIGDFTWTGYDYLGEAGLACYHYAPERHEQGWYPDRLAYCGDINLNGYRRPVSYLREIAFGLRTAPFIAVERVNRYGQADNTNDWKYFDALDSWTFDGYEGKPAVVHVLSASEEVELFLNGASLGRKKAGEAVGFDVYYQLAYMPGELTAIGYTNGNEDGRCTLKTAKEPQKLAVSLDRDTLAADGRSLAFLTMDLLDADGVPNRWLDRDVSVTVEGAGVLAGFGSADPQAEESYQQNVWKAFDGRVMAVIRSTNDPGNICVCITANGCEPCCVTLRSR